jgi:hypothetical protein
MPSARALSGAGIAQRGSSVPVPCVSVGRDASVHGVSDRITLIFFWGTDACASALSRLARSPAWGDWPLRESDCRVAGGLSTHPCPLRWVDPWVETPVFMPLLTESH